MGVHREENSSAISGASLRTAAREVRPGAAAGEKENAADEVRASISDKGRRHGSGNLTTRFRIKFKCRGAIEISIYV